MVYEYLPTVVSAACAIATSYFIADYFKKNARHQELMAKAQRKYQERNTKRQKHRHFIREYFNKRNITTEQVEYLATLSTKELLNEIFSGGVSIADCVAASSYVALRTGILLEANAEELFTEAIQEAIEYDINLQQTKHYSQGNDSTDTTTTSSTNNTDELGQCGGASTGLNSTGDENAPKITPPPDDITHESIGDDDIKNILYGVPISIKDQIDMKGYDSTCGLAARVFQPSDEDAVVVKLLREQGAIPIVRGNAPTMLMMPETENTVYKRTLNAYNDTKAAGGSSGGDGVLVSTRAVKIGIGTDIGGSLRIPSHYSALYTIKPTPHRISMKGISSPTPAPQQQIATAVGPMSNTTDGVIRVMRSWLLPRMRQLDPYIPPTQWNHQMFHGSLTISNQSSQQTLKQPELMQSLIPNIGKKLRIGYFAHDGYVDVPPVAYRSVDMVKQTLESLGHELIVFQPPKVDRAVELYLSLLGADGNMQSFIDGLAGEKMHSIYSKIKFSASLPRFLRPVIAQLMTAIGEHRTARVVESAYAKSTYEYWAEVHELLRYKDDFLDYWQSLELDAVICPGVFTPAVTHQASKDYLPLFVSCFLWNLLEYPVGTVPVTFVRKNEDDLLKFSKCKDSLTRAAHHGMKDSTGLPFGVQIASLPYYDELVLRIMTQLEIGLEHFCEDKDDVDLHSTQQRFLPPISRVLFKVNDDDDDDNDLRGSKSS